MPTKKFGQNLILILVSVVFTLFVLEIGLRIMNAVDNNGSLKIGTHILYFDPTNAVRRLENSVNFYIHSELNPNSLYNESTGWSHAPGFSDSLYTFNSSGIRAKSEYALEPQPGVLRIAVFGDSFTEGNEVGDEETWAYYLEQTLNERGINVEVLNFGEPGYGIDQAYLRWQSAGQRYSPDIVIFGFQPENMHRNQNIIRDLYRDGISPFSKPRFILENGDLELINQPAIPPEELVEVLQHFDTHPLAAHERFFVWHDFSQDWWLHSRLLTVLFGTQYMVSLKEAFTDSPEPFFEGSDLTTLAQAIVDQFAEDVAQEGSRFVVAHLPNQGVLPTVLNGEQLTYQFLLDHFAEVYRLVQPDDQLSMDDSYWMAGGHYSAVGNRIVAMEIADSIESCLADLECKPQRLTNT